MAKQVQTVPQTMLPGMVDDTARRRLLDSFAVSVEGRLVYANRLPSREERTILQTWNADLVRALRPASMAVAELEEARRHLAALFLGYGSMRYEGDAIDEIVNAYMLVLQKYPLFAIVRAVADVAGNAVAGLNPDRPPTSPRMGKIAADHVAMLAGHQLKIDRVLQAKALMVSSKSAADRARVLASLQDFHGKMTPVDMGGTLEPDEKRTIEERRKRDNNAAILREYANLGISPRYTKAGVLLSPALARQVGAMDDSEAAIR